MPNFGRVFGALAKAAREVAEEKVEQFAREECAAFKAAIQAQDFVSFSMIPLSDAYLGVKEKLGLDMRTMIATGHYVDSIRVFNRTNPDNSTTFYVGFHQGEHARDLKGQETDFLLTGSPGVAEVQEFGSIRANVPARPHWRPYYRRMHQWAPRVRHAIRKETLKRVKQRVPEFA